MTDAENVRLSQKIEVDLAAWLELQRRVGLAEGILWGWLHSDGETERCKVETVKFLEKSDG